LILLDTNVLSEFRILPPHRHCEEPQATRQSTRRWIATDLRPSR